MARVYVDVNVLINLVEKQPTVSANELAEQTLLLSPLSIHNLLYVSKQRIPSETLSSILEQFLLVNFDNTIVYRAKEGPTTDFEDNVQLHSCEAAQCDIFLTQDRELLKLKFFGKARILSPEEFSRSR